MCIRDRCNIALCGLFLCCLKLGVIDSLALIVAAVLNLILAVFNMTLIEGLDGMGIFGEIFTGSDDFVERAKKLVRDVYKRQWYGGEPLLYPEIIKNMSEKIHTLVDKYSCELRCV